MYSSESERNSATRVRTRLLRGRSPALLSLSDEDSPILKYTQFFIFLTKTPIAPTPWLPLKDFFPFRCKIYEISKCKLCLCCATGLLSYLDRSVESLIAQKRSMDFLKMHWRRRDVTWLIHLCVMSPSPSALWIADVSNISEAWFTDYKPVPPRAGRYQEENHMLKVIGLGI